MDNQNTEAQDLIVQAREALRRGDKETAHSLGEQAALLAPGLEDAWLVLTASDPNPEDALAYAQQALEINPSSARALKAVEWAIARLKQAQTAPETVEAVAAASTPVPPAAGQEKPPAAKKSNNRPLIFAALFLLLLLCAVGVIAAYTGITHFAFGSILNSAPTPTQENLWAPMKLVKPSVTPLSGSAVIQQVLASPTPTLLNPGLVTSVPTETPASAPTETSTPTPTQIPTEASTTTMEANGTPGSMSMQIVDDTPTSEYVAPTSSTSSAPLPAVASSGDGARWIDVDLTNQMVYAYEGDAVINSFLVSTGTWLTPTVTGQYKIYVKYRSAPMSGPGYYLPNVPYIMYFYKGYGLHGTYWHNNFGTPMSHGCVNLRTDEASWLYSWASVGTLVNVHY